MIETYCVGCGVGVGEEGSLSEVAEIEGSSVLENVELVLILVLKY